MIIIKINDGTTFDYRDGNKQVKEIMYNALATFIEYSERYNFQNILQDKRLITSNRKVEESEFYMFYGDGLGKRDELRRTLKMLRKRGRGGKSKKIRKTKKSRKSRKSRK